MPVLRLLHHYRYFSNQNNVGGLLDHIAAVLRKPTDQRDLTEFTSTVLLQLDKHYRQNALRPIAQAMVNEIAAELAEMDAADTDDSYEAGEGSATVGTPGFNGAPAYSTRSKSSSSSSSSSSAGFMANV